MAYTREEKPTKAKEQVKACAEEQETDGWDELFSRNTYWRVLRITAWVLRFKTNTLAKSKKIKKKSGPLCTEELAEATLL